MPTKPKKCPRDTIELAKLAGDIATGKVDDAEPDDRNPSAVELGKLGDAKGGKARASKLPPGSDGRLPQQAVRARWRKN